MADTPDPKPSIPLDVIGENQGADAPRSPSPKKPRASKKPPVPDPEAPPMVEGSVALPGSTEPTLPPSEKVRRFPRTPGVYLMKDADGRVIYVGKAKNLRARAGSYFLAQAAVDQRTRELVKHIADIDFIPAETEVERRPPSTGSSANSRRAPCQRSSRTRSASSPSRSMRG